MESRKDVLDRALCNAARWGRLQQVQLLLQPCTDASRALIVAAKHGHTDVAQCLISAATDLNYIDDNGRTALHAAAGSGDVAVVELLLRSGANPNVQAGKSCTALQAACEAGSHREDVVDLLLQHGADVNVEGGWYGSALLAAISARNDCYVKRLLTAGAHVDDIRPRVLGGYSSALSLAIGDGSFAIVQSLLDAGADIELLERPGVVRYGYRLQVAVLLTQRKVKDLFYEPGWTGKRMQLTDADGGCVLSAEELARLEEKSQQRLASMG